MKLKYSWKRLSLVAIVLMFYGGLMMLPPAMGAVGGTTIGSAPTVKPGVYPNEVRPDPGSLFYNVSGTVGANLTVIEVGLDGYSEVFIWAPNGTRLTIGSVTLYISIASVIFDSKGLYTIEVLTSIGVKAPGEITFTLTICIDGNCAHVDEIPGFDLLVGSFSLVILLGVVLLLSRRTKQFL
ncbi:MAG: hypothetical protein LUQ65_13720 [Candidatus Helarchaeota archaeon]|nr:hypothetical protein [Candidatus Helarchaeota archaeon]